MGLLLLVFSITASYALEPIAQVLTQAKLDRFLVDLEAITGDTVVSTAWNNHFQQASFDELMNQNSTLGSADPLTAVMTIMLNARERAKKDTDLEAVLKGYGWNKEFWDIYVIVMIGAHYSSIMEGQEEIAAFTHEDADSMIDILPPIELFMNKADFDLFAANYGKLKNLVDEEIRRTNRF